MTQGPPPVQPTPLDSGRVLTELSGTSIDIGNVVIEDPSTGLPIQTQNGGLQTYIVGPDPLPIVAAVGSLYRAAGNIASLAAAGGTQALPAALATTRITAISISILPTAALAGVPALRVTLQATGGAVLAEGVVSGTTPWVVALPSGSLVGTGGALSLAYGANSGSLELDYTITGVSP